MTMKTMMMIATTLVTQKDEKCKCDLYGQREKALAYFTSTNYIFLLTVIQLCTCTCIINLIRFIKLYSLHKVKT